MTRLIRELMPICIVPTENHKSRQILNRSPQTFRPIFWWYKFIRSATGRTIEISHLFFWGPFNGTFIRSDLLCPMSAWRVLPAYPRPSSSFTYKGRFVPIQIVVRRLLSFWLRVVICLPLRTLIALGPFPRTKWRFRSSDDVLFDTIY